MTTLIHRFLDIRSVPSTIVMATVIVSYAGLALVAALGWPLWAVVAAASAPWLVIFGLEVQWTYRHFGWLALMYLLVLTQGGHFIEHLVQMVQIHLMDTPAPEAHGIFGQLDIEWVHFGFNTWIMIAVSILLVKYRDNGWLWLTLLVAAWHQVEHTYIMFQYLGDFGRPGHPGLLSSGGAIGGGVNVARPDLHFLYNVVETAPMFVAFGVALKRVHNEWIEKAFPGASANLLTEATQAATTQTFQPGEDIVRQGDAADAFFIIAKGEVVVRRKATVDAEPVHLTTLGPGRYFGEMGLLAGEPRTATVTAVDKVEVLRLGRDAFEMVVRESEETAIDLTEVARQRHAAANS